MVFWRFWRRQSTPAVKAEKSDRGFLFFQSTSEVIRAEKVLKSEGWPIRVMGPPPEFRRGCDLVIEFPLLAELKIVGTLSAAGVPPLQAVPVSGPLLEPVNLFHIKDFGAYLMVRAANMKLTIDKASQVIVNISGGGCPDVPYLAQEMVGKTLSEAPKPCNIGHTLCGYALQLAFEEVQRQCS
jgi:hypothetical protein